MFTFLRFHLNLGSAKFFLKYAIQIDLDLRLRVLSSQASKGMRVWNGLF